MRFWRQRKHEELDAEIRNHLDQAMRDRLALGEAPNEARSNALREFGNVTLVKEVTREMWGWSWLERLMQDLKFGARMLVKQPGFTVIAVLTLALGIGANTAIFSLINAVLLRSLPFPQPEQIVTLWEEVPSERVTRQGFAPGNYTDLKAQQTVFAQMTGLFQSEMILTGEGEPEKLEGFVVLESEAFDILGITPTLGRHFLPDEYVRGRHNVLLISHRFWQQRFGGSLEVIGKDLVLNDEKFVIVGVLPSDFQFLNPNVSFWAPAGYSSSMLGYRGSHNMRVLARLRSGVTPAQALAEVKTRMQQIALAHPEEPRDLSAYVQPLHEYLTGEARRPLLVLLIGVGFVLLIACANLANLLLARAAARRKEIAVRVALGAKRGRIVRQLLTESVLLSLIGGACGLFLAPWSFAVLRQMIPPGMTGSANLALDVQVLVYTVGLSVLTGILFGLAPAWQATHADVNEVLKQSGPRAGIAQRRLQNVLVVAEVALALVLLIGAGLWIQSFYNLRQVDVGFRTDNLLTFQARLPRTRYREHTQRMVFFEQTLQRLRALPGVVSAAYASHLPLAGRGGVYKLNIEGRPTQAGITLEAGHSQISPEYFSTLGIQIRQGRAFDEHDSLQTPGVAIVNETMARKYWPNENVLGKRFSIDDDVAGRPVPPLTIIGVVGDVKQGGLEGETRPQLYLPHSQVTYNSFSIPGFWVIRTSGEPLDLAAGARSAIHAVDPNLLVAEVGEMEARLDELVAPRRLRTTLLMAYASLALLLAALGIYGVLAYFVTQHTPEIGIRLALGAHSGDVLRLVLRRGLGLALAGVALGLISALALTRMMEGLLFGVEAGDPLTFGVLALLMLSVALVSCWIPARRGARVDPLVALRTE